MVQVNTIFLSFDNLFIYFKFRTLYKNTTKFDKEYRICGLFGSDFNLAVWQIFIGLPNLNHAVLTRTHEMN